MLLYCKIEVHRSSFVKLDLIFQLLRKSCKSIVISREIANFSKTIKRDVGKNEKEIPLSTISSEILKEIVTNLDTIITHARKHIKGNGYVTQDVQNIINEAFKDKKNNFKFIQEYINAIDYLDIPILLNVLACFVVKQVIVDEIQPPVAMLPYIKKYRMLGATPEITIADYIALYPSDQSLIGPFRKFFNSLTSPVSITSLVGIEDLDAPETIGTIWISNLDDLLGPDYDPDFPQEPFKNMVNIEAIYLQDNDYLTSLPKTFFKGLKKLQHIDLQKNGLTTLPGSLFQGLDSIQVINLEYNKLKSLPKEIFSGLPNKSTIILDYNNFSNKEKADIIAANKNLDISI